MTCRVMYDLSASRSLKVEKRLSTASRAPSLTIRTATNAKAPNPTDGITRNERVGRETNAKTQKTARPTAIQTHEPREPLMALAHKTSARPSAAKALRSRHPPR